MELLWLLLPVAAASGWMAARRSERRSSEPKASGCDNHPAYFRGLNHLLNEEPDKAIDVFVEMLEVDSETVETHLALGNLFRRRGEVERSIRIHQNLIARPALTGEQRAEALLELGKDYMRAGLYDRAENLFKELRDSELRVIPALRNLRWIYQQEKDWEACLSVTEALQPLVDESLGIERAHYFCELAAAAVAVGQSVRAKDLLKAAVEADYGCVRALHMRADLAMQDDDFKTAILLYHEAAERDPEYLPEILPDLVEAYKRGGDIAGLRQYLDQLLAQRSGSSVDLIAVNLVKETDGDAAAARLLGERVRQSPSLKGLLRLVELNARIPEHHAAEVLSGLHDHIQHLLEERPQYQCHKCGFAAKTLHWQCPCCRGWGSVRRKPDIDDCIQVKT
jgi:lipopolysaccharide biosynthesis regulator YciM